MHTKDNIHHVCVYLCVAVSLDVARERNIIHRHKKEKMNHASISRLILTVYVCVLQWHSMLLEEAVADKGHGKRAPRVHANAADRFEDLTAAEDESKND